MPVYVIISDYEDMTVVAPAAKDEDFGLLGRLVYPDAFSALAAARSFREFITYGFDAVTFIFDGDRLGIFEADADWETDTVETPGERVSYEEMHDFPEGLESAQSTLPEEEDQGRFLTKPARVGRLVQTV